MRLTAQEEYGLRCLLQIAREPGGFLTIPEISAREGLSTPYVAKLMRILREAELVESIRGQKGGFRLALRPDQISLGRVLRVLDGQLYTKDFCKRYTGNEVSCAHDSDCSVRTLWSVLDRAVQGVLIRMTLKHLLVDEREMDSWARNRSESAAVAGESPELLPSEPGAH